MGRADESIEIVEKAKEIDPLSPVSCVGLAGSLYFARRYDEAIKHIQEGSRLIPTILAAFRAWRAL